MLLVRDSMTREVVTISPQTTAAEALALCREKGIRHLPVMEEGGLVGLVSDRDLRSATPTLGDPARAEALQKIRVWGVMLRDVLTAHPEDPIEQAANTMREKKIGCLPVLEAGELAGILTSSDVMEALVYLIGAHEPGSRVEVLMPHRPGTLAGVAGLFGELGINIVSVVAGARQEAPEGGVLEGRIGILKIDTIDPKGAVEVLRQAGYRVLWPPLA
ncbi:MAG: CBS and ACT domain-containing protein [Actinomycetota bacterium]|nr:CBS and ACT domain-containing protein [Actinomycetota bacterium]